MDEKFITIMSSIDKTLKLILECLSEQNALLKSDNGALKNNISNRIEEQGKIFRDVPLNFISSISPSSSIFKMISNIYIEEEIERIKNGKRKKSARRLSVNIGNALIQFFKENLNIVNLSIERSTDGGLIIFSKNEVPFATLKYMTDLGYNRSEAFYKAVDAVVETSTRNYGVKADYVFILISSLLNGVEKSFVEKILKTEVGSTLEFLTNRSKVKEFLEVYLSQVTSFKDPKNNIFLLGADLHPNVVSTQIIEGNFSTEETDRVIEQYPWLGDVGNLLTMLEKTFE